MSEGPALAPRPRADLVGQGVCLALVAVLLFVGWREFWFLTDDAFITFRYIDHHRRGWGWVWNPPPFRPVEGYSNFLWMILLEVVWKVTGAPPPETANRLSLAFSYGTLALAFLTVRWMSLPAVWARHRSLLPFLVLGAAVVNPTFLIWTSSGLETALYGFASAAWVLGALNVQRHPDRRPLLIASTGAALAALTRPDGMLLLLVTPLLLWQGPSNHRTLRSRLVQLGPLLLPLVHLLWRRAYYDSWLPNTYHAKNVAAWPDAGLRYTTSYVLEYGLLAWGLVALLVAALAVLRVQREGVQPGRIRPWLPAATVVATLGAQVAYYTFIAGGDHFEYRPFAHLVLPMSIALVRLVVALPTRPGAGITTFVVVTVLGLVIPWVHRANTKGLVRREETFMMTVPLANHFPAGLPRWYVHQLDRLQAWMQPHHVGTRYQEHKVFYYDQVLRYPSRAQGEKLTWQHRAVLPLNTVGIPGWNLPEVAIIDVHGLNDRVAANTLVTDPNWVRKLAHERWAPPPYIQCFIPNVDRAPPRIYVRERQTPLTDERIRECERQFMPW
jgi:arabinofuranosyltransferase